MMGLDIWWGVMLWILNVRYTKRFNWPSTIVWQIFILPMKSNSRMPWNGRHVVYLSVNFKSRSLITYLVLVVFWFIWWHFFSCFFFRLDDSFLILPKITHLTLYTIHFLSFKIVISVFMYTTRVWSLIQVNKNWKCDCNSNLLTVSLFSKIKEPNNWRKSCW